MEQAGKISPFQLTALLLLARLFTVMTYAPRLEGNGTSAVAILSTVLSPLLQYAVLAVGLWLCKRKNGLSPLYLTGRGGKAVHKVVSAGYWIFSMLVCFYSSINFIRLLSSGFYNYQFAWVIGLTLFIAAGFGVLQGIEAFARTAPLLTLLVFAGLILLGLGMAGQADPYNLVVPVFEKRSLLSGIWQGMAMNFELVALLLLQPITSTERVKGKAVCVWLGLIALLTILMIVGVILTLGYYAQGKNIPIFTAAKAAQLLALKRLDSALMGIWVVLGFIKITLYLFIAVSMWGELFHPKENRWPVIGHCIVLFAASLGVVWLPDFLSVATAAAGAGVLTLMGTLLLPALGCVTEKLGGERGQT